MTWRWKAHRCEVIGRHCRENSKPGRLVSVPRTYHFDSNIPFRIGHLHVHPVVEWLGASPVLRQDEGDVDSVLIFDGHVPVLSRAAILDFVWAGGCIGLNAREHETASCSVGAKAHQRRIRGRCIRQGGVGGSTQTRYGSGHNGTRVQDAGRTNGEQSGPRSALDGMFYTGTRVAFVSKPETMPRLRH